MARSPQDNQVFLREVDEELRRDEMERFWKRWGLWVAAAVILALLAFGGWLIRQQRAEAAAGQQGVVLDGAIEKLSQNQVAAARPELESLQDSQRPGYRAAARLALADAALQEGRLPDAVRLYSSVAADQGVGQPFRDLALLRATTAEFDTLAPDTVVQRLRPLAQAGNPWFGSAGELTGLAHLKAGRGAEAQRVFNAVANDAAVPQSIRSRAVQLAGLDPAALRPGAPPAAAQPVSGPAAAAPATAAHVQDPAR